MAAMGPERMVGRGLMGLKRYGGLKGQRCNGGGEGMRELLGQRWDGVAKEKSCDARQQQKQANNAEQLHTSLLKLSHMSTVILQLLPESSMPVF